MKNLTKVTLVLGIILVKMITYPVILLYSARNCVQHFTVSSTLLCPLHRISQNTVSTPTQRFICSPFTCQRAAFVSGCVSKHLSARIVSGLAAMVKCKQPLLKLDKIFPYCLYTTFKNIHSFLKHLSETIRFSICFQ